MTDAAPAKVHLLRKSRELRQKLQPPVIDPKAPQATAKLFLETHYRRDGIPTLRRHRGGFYLWNGSSFDEAADAEIRARIYEFLEGAITPDHQPFKPARSKVNDVVDALEAAAILPHKVSPPAWIDRDETPAGEIMAFKNGLLHLPTRKLMPATPAFFGLNSVDYEYDQSAGEPTQWLEFLHTIWPNDGGPTDDELEHDGFKKETFVGEIETLQEMFGYLLSQDTTQQKAFLIVGPKRSGKGTIAAC